MLPWADVVAIAVMAAMALVSVGRKQGGAGLARNMGRANKKGPVSSHSWNHTRLETIDGAIG